MGLFEFDDYKLFVTSWVKSQPKKGHGQFLRIAKVLSTSPTIVSLIFKGERHVSLEQAADLAGFFSFTPLEIEYFFLLVQRGRAGSHRLRLILDSQILALKKKSQDLKERIHQDKELSDEAKSVFYTHWAYTGICNLAAIENFQTAEAICAHLNLPREKTIQFINFLLQNGLLKEEGGKISPHTARTHLAAGSPLVGRHHTNWRLKAMEKYDNINPQNEVIYTCPMSLSVEDLQKIRTTILEFIDRVDKIIGPSPSETTACLNIDWFTF